MATPPRRLQQLPRADALRLLGSVPMGRVVYTAGGLPTVRPVNHIVDDGAVVIRTYLASATLGSEGAVVAYQADLLDSSEHTGWSVIVTGLAQLVADGEQVRRYEGLIHPWIAVQTTHVIRIEAEVVSGFELVELVED